MKWKQRNPLINSFEELIKENVKMPLDEFLNPKADPYIKNLSLAVRYAKDKIASGLPVRIIGDYDADGVFATLILLLGIEEYSGEKPWVRIPKRRAEGYGLNVGIIDEIDNGLIITVDNGISAVDAIQKAKDKGLDVIILDHHERREDGIIPNADVVVDPSAIPGSEFNYYCGAGLAYRFIKELNPNSKILDKLLVFASIATVADVMELVGDNRNIVKKGLELINQRKVTLGLNTLINELGIAFIDEDTYGFKIGPVVNASGRLYDDGPMDVIELLSNDCDVFDDNQVQKNEELAQLLIERNTERQDLVKRSMTIAEDIIKGNNLKKRSMTIAEDIIKENNLKNDALLVVYHPEFDEGIIGIIAGQLAEKYRRPAIAFTNSKKEGIYKGSGRNYGDVNLKSMLDYSKELFVGYGGHKGAAGMSIPSENIEKLKIQSFEYLKNTGFNFTDDLDTSYYDLEIPEVKVAETIQLLKQYAPYGQGNPRPVFKIAGYSLKANGSDFFKVMGRDRNHLRFFGKFTNAVGFDMVKTYDEAGKPKVMNVLGNLSQNYFNGKFTDQIEIVEFESAETKATNEVADSLRALLTF